MTNVMKRLLALLLTMVMVLSMVPASVFAAETDTGSGITEQETETGPPSGETDVPTEPTLVPTVQIGEAENGTGEESTFGTTVPSVPETTISAIDPTANPSSEVSVFYA